MKLLCLPRIRRHGAWIPILAFLLAGVAAGAQSIGLLREFYVNIPGNSISDLTSAPIFPDRPTSTIILTEFLETGPDESDEYGQRIRGFLNPPETGDYIFWIASDDQSILYLSTDSDPIRKRVVASVSSWTGFREWLAEANQQSLPIRLEAGRNYYIEVLMKEGLGGDHLSVRWSLPSGAIEEPIPATQFLPFGTPLFPPEITRQPASVTIDEGASATFRIQVSNSDPVRFQWQRNGTTIPGATGPVLTLARVSLLDSGSSFRCTLVNPLGITVSEEAVLTVVPDNSAPRLDSVFNSSSTNVVVRFSEPINTNASARPVNFLLSGGVTVGSVRAGSGDAELILNTSPLTPGTTYTLTVNGVTDRATQPNSIAANSRFDFIALNLAPVAIGRPAVEATVQPILGGVNITALGRGLSGTNDQLHFSYQLRPGNFDVQVRLESLDLGTLFSQAGLMVRQSLAADSVFAASLATPSLAGSYFSWRGTTGSVAEVRGSFPANYPQTWLRLRRAGTNFTGFASYDGASWSQLGAAGIGMSNAVYVGLTLSSRSTNAAAVAAFREFKDVAAAVPAGSFPPRLEPIGPSSRRTGLTLTEIMFHPQDRPDNRRLEFIEIFNADSVFADLGGSRLSGDIEYVFPSGTRLAAGAFAVVAAAPADLAAVYPLREVFGPWQGQLPRDQGTIRLRHRTGAVLLETTYADEPPWPIAADGAGHSLVLARPSHGEGSVRAWDASTHRGGSPGHPEVIVPDRLQFLVINEVLAHTDDPVPDFIELHNSGTASVDLSGCILTDDASVPKFRVPARVTLPAGGHVAWNQNQLGFALSAAGEAVYLLDPDAGRVIDAVRFGAQFNGVSGGRTPDGSEVWQNLAVPTPGSANGPAWSSRVVINEIMYRPPVGEIGEFIELYNRGSTAVNLRDWRMVDGVEFTFTNDVILAPGAFLIVAGDATYLRSAYPDLDPARIAGTFTGDLSNAGERLALAQPEWLVTTNASGILVTNRVFVTVGEVTYADGGRWGRWSDGGGSSLELIDPRADTRLAPSWADSDETAESPWITVDFTGPLELGQGQAAELHVMLLGEGECLIDDVEVLDQSGANRISNSNFEGGLVGWVAQGNHVGSGSSTNGYSSRRSLHLRASDGGDNGANRIKTSLTGGPLFENAFATIRARVRWLHGHSDLLFRLKGNYLETTATLALPSHLGTPGARNSRAVTNAAPAIVDVRHFPVVPAALEPVTVTASVHDPDGVGGVTLRVRYDPSVTIQGFSMRDDGESPDGIAGDGIYSATLPGQAAGVLAAFWVEASDAAPRPASATFPVDPSRGECLVRFGDEILSGSFGTYRLWMTQRNTDAWTEREVMSNEPLDGTLVYGTSRAIYNGGARYRGSPFIRPGYSGPTGSLCAYVWTTPADDLLLGSDEFNLDWLEQPGRDPTLQRERMSFWVGDQLGVPFSHQRYVRILVNGVRRGEVYTDSQQPNGDYVSSWFPDADRGEIFKIDDWFEFNDAVQREFNVDARLERFPDSASQTHKTRYRWNWEKKSNRGLDDNYSHLLALVEALDSPDEEFYTRRVAELVDLDGWLRTIATRRIVADWDGYGYARGKNTFAYLPPGGRWSLLLWDLDFSLGGGSDGPSTELYSAEDPTMERVYRHPEFGRVYLQAFLDAVRGPLASGIAEPLLEANYAAFVGNGVVASSPSPIRSFITDRREFLNRILATNTAPWSIQGQGDGGSTTNQNLITLTGTAPIDVRSIAVNGLAYQPSWVTRSQWTLRIPLRAGTNFFALEGLDRRGDPVPGAAGNVTIRYAGEEESPENFVRMTEIMFEPLDPDAEFVEVHNASARTTFDLSGWQVAGIDFTFMGGTSLAPGGFLLLVKDRAIFERVYGPGLPVVGEYPGRLNNAGETIRLSRPGTPSQPFRTVTEVTYSNRAPWPARAAGAGGSLQVLDPSQDIRRPANWYALDAQGHGFSTWQFASMTARAQSSQLLIALGNAGVVHVDDVSLVAGVIPRVGTELIANGGFEQPLAPHWIPGTAVSDSAMDPAVRRSGRSSLRLVATQPGGSAGTSLRQTLSSPLVPGEFYTLSYWYLPDPSGGDLTVRLDAGALISTVDALEDPVPAATPGAINSVQTALAPFPDLWINEVLPRGTVSPDAAWIELFNAGPVSVNLGGWYLSSDPEDPGEWPFPVGASIAPGEFLLIPTGPSVGVPPGLRANLILSPREGSVILARTGNGVPVPVDYVHYASLAPGRSTGSYPDGAWTERQIFELPTPGAPNDLTSLPSHLTVNEWMSRNTGTIADPADGDYDDWFELYNAGDQTVDLSGYSLTDDLEDPRRTVIPDGFAVAPRSALLVWADGEPGQTGRGRSLHVDFALSASGESIALYSPGGALVDLVTFGPLDRDVSEGLRPDGAIGSFARLDSPSPGALNSPTSAGGPRFTNVTRAPAQVTLVWSSVAGQTYQVQSTDTLGFAWANLGAQILAGETSTTFTDTSHANSSTRFYRVLWLGP